MDTHTRRRTDESASTRAYKALESMVVTLELPPGSATTEAVLIERLGLGRTPVRDALQRLSWEGLIEVRPRAGIAVAPLHVSDWVKVVDARRGVEMVLARAAARFVTDGTAARYHEAALNIRKAVVAGDVRAFLEADKELDQTIGAASDNPFAARLAAPLQTHSRRFWFRYQADDGLARAAEQHVRLIDAILKGDEERATSETERFMRFLRTLAETARSQ